ncbi:MAG: LysR family transcriptional regulator, partial [Betaproteobacteria bacterium]|nr:LysR family transcriptional regulator [Betaproteobacteria bacterium]
MDLKQIEYFVRVAEMGSFTRAAIALNVAQPALSRQVRLLEVELRQTPLKRNGRGASPTEAGLLLLEHGRGILHQIERTHEALGRARSGLTGRVALGLPPSVARVLTVPLTRAFREKMPDAQLSISEGLTSAMQESLLNGRLDIALLYNMKPTSGLEVSHLVQEELWLVRRRPPGLQEDPPPPPIEFKDVAKLAVVKLQQRLAEGTGKTAFKDYIAIINTYLIPALGNRLITNIDKAALEHLDNERIKR